MHCSPDNCREKGEQEKEYKVYYRSKEYILGTIAQERAPNPNVLALMAESLLYLHIPLEKTEVRLIE